MQKLEGGQEQYPLCLQVGKLELPGLSKVTGSRVGSASILSSAYCFSDNTPEPCKAVTVKNALPESKAEALPMPPVSQQPVFTLPDCTSGCTGGSLTNPRCPQQRQDSFPAGPTSPEISHKPQEAVNPNPGEESHIAKRELTAGSHWLPRKNCIEGMAV